MKIKSGKKQQRRSHSLILGALLAFCACVLPAQAGLLNLVAPFTLPGLYPTPSSPQSVARMNAIKVYNSGVHEWKNKNLRGAVECFQQALSFDPNMREVHGALGQVLYDAGYYDDAFRELQIATQDYPSDGAYWCMLGLASGHLQRYDVTVDAFQKYLKLKPHGSYADEAKRSIAILQHTVYGGDADRTGSYFAEFPATNLRKWNSNMIPLRVYIDNGANVQGFDPAFANALQQSFNDWTMLSEGRIQFAQVDAPEKAQICCRWTPNRADLGGSDELGVTHSTWLTTGNIEHADIILLTIYESSPRPQEMLRRAKAVYLHEIGHALGLSHSQEPWDIMYPLVAPSGLEFPLTLRDKNTLLSLYNSDPSGLIAKRFDASFAPGRGGSLNSPGAITLNPNGSTTLNPNGAMAMNSPANTTANSSYGYAAPPINAFAQPVNSLPHNGAEGGYTAISPPRAMPLPTMLASNALAQNSQYGAQSYFPVNVQTAPQTFQPGSLAQPFAQSFASGNMEQISSLNRAAAQATARRDFDGAISKLLEARRLAPGDQIIARNLGLAFGNAANVASEAGDFTRALNNFKSAFEILKNGSERGPYDQIYNDYQSMLKRQGKR